MTDAWPQVRPEPDLDRLAELYAEWYEVPPHRIDDDDQPQETGPNAAEATAGQ